MSIAIAEQPNYAVYSIEELEDVLENIDKQAFPERYQAVKNELADNLGTLASNAIIPNKIRLTKAVTQ